MAHINTNSFLSLASVFALTLTAVSCSPDLPEDAFNASVTVNTEIPGTTYDPMIFGGFIEHFNRQIYGGVYDPGSPLADKEGFRTDVIEALKELRITVVRWPGGCFVDGYHWQDGIGPDRQPKDDIVRWNQDCL